MAIALRFASQRVAPEYAWYWRVLPGTGVAAAVVLRSGHRPRTNPTERRAADHCQLSAALAHRLMALSGYLIDLFVHLQV